MMSNFDWKPTHEITLPNGLRVEVMLEERIAFSCEEWVDYEGADFEVDNDGNWMFQGQNFDGTVRRIGS